MLQVGPKLFGEGKSYSEVAIFLGVHRATLSRWLDDGTSPDCAQPEIVEFAQQCALARAKRNSDFRNTVWRAHCEASDRAALAEMRAIYPEEYDRAQHKVVEHRTKVDPIPDLLADMTPEELRLQAAYEDMQERKAAQRNRGGR